MTLLDKVGASESWVRPCGGGDRELRRERRRGPDVSNNQGTAQTLQKYGNSTNTYGPDPNTGHQNRLLLQRMGTVYKAIPVIEPHRVDIFDDFERT